MEKGDYVLATKYSDGDPGDHWCVGFYDRVLDNVGGVERHMVTDDKGNQFRGNGFRRVAKISAERGAYLLENAKTIDIGSRSVWWWKRTRMSAE